MSSNDATLETIRFDDLAKVQGGTQTCEDPNSPFYHDPRAGGVVPCEIGNPGSLGQIGG